MSYAHALRPNMMSPRLCVPVALVRHPLAMEPEYLRQEKLFEAFTGPDGLVIGRHTVHRRDERRLRNVRKISP